MALIMFVSILTLIPAGVLAYGIAVSKVSSKNIIVAVLIAVGVCTLISIIGSGYGIMIGLCLCMAFIIVYSIYLGTKTGNKFNAVGIISLVVYVFSIFKLPLITNEYEDSAVYEWAEELASSNGIKLTPTQFDIFGLPIADDDMNWLIIIFMAVGICTVLFFSLMLIRKNSAQVVVGCITSLLTAGMLYFDYSIYNSKSVMGKLFGKAFSEMGFSLSITSVLILVLPVLATVMAYVCSRKDKKKTLNDK